MNQRLQKVPCLLAVLAGLAGGLGAIGCTASLSSPDPQGTQSPGAGGANGGKGGGTSDGDPNTEGNELPSVHTTDGLRPLSRREYTQSLQQVLGVTIDAAQAPLETLVAGHSKIAKSQEIVHGEVESYYQLGLDAAEAAVKGLDCAPVTDACARAFADPFLRLAFRETPSQQTRAHYLSLLDTADAGETVEERLVTMITAALSSPLFLYRTEIGAGSTPGDPLMRELTHYEIAARLAFLAWEAPPDDELLAAAEAGRLSSADDREAQLDRLLADPRARNGLRGFVGDWMGIVDPESRISVKNAEVLKNTPADLEARAAASLNATVDRVLADGTGAFLDLLKTDAYIADGAIGDLLGLGGSQDEGLRTLNTDQRRGVLLHPAVLAAHTSEGGASPFPIGKFVYENVLCGVLGNIPMIPAIDESDLGGKTLRETLEEATAHPACQTCHAKIGPPGFAFLSYDVVGRHKPTDDHGKPVDTAGMLDLPDGAISFAGAPDLSQGLAEHPQAARCVARRLFRWTFGRFEAPEDQALLSKLEAQAVMDGAAVETLLAALVRADDFTRVRMETP